MTLQFTESARCFRDVYKRQSLATLHQAVVAPHAGVSIGRCAVVIAHFCNLVRQREVFVPSPSVLGIFQPQLIKDILVVEPCLLYTSTVSLMTQVLWRTRQPDLCKAASIS